MEWDEKDIPDPHREPSLSLRGRPGTESIHEPNVFLSAEGRKVVNCDGSRFSAPLFPAKVMEKSTVLPFMPQSAYSIDSHNTLLLTHNKIRLVCFLLNPCCCKRITSLSVFELLLFYSGGDLPVCLINSLVCNPFYYWTKGRRAANRPHSFTDCWAGLAT